MRMRKGMVEIAGFVEKPRRGGLDGSVVTLLGPPVETGGRQGSPPRRTDEVGMRLSHLSLASWEWTPFSAWIIHRPM